MKVRASSGGNLFPGFKNQITDKQLQEIKTLEEKQSKKPLTTIQGKKLQSLKAKAAAPPELSDTVKTLMIDIWLQENYQVRKDISNDAINKGLINEDIAIEMLSKLHWAEYSKNEESFENEFFTGTPDIITDDTIIDIKCSRDIWTFQKSGNEELTKTSHPLYYAQLQIYMELTGRSKAALCYVLTNTPDYQVEKMIYNASKDLEEIYIEDINEVTVQKMEQIQLNTNYDRIPLEHRIKYLPIEKDEQYISDIKEVMIQAREFYKTIKL